jgi:alkylation response protein AidB-like acyl-CoA dehydrogenase
MSGADSSGARSATADGTSGATGTGTAVRPPGTPAGGPGADGSRTPDLLYSEIEEDLRSSVRALLTERSPWQAVLARTEQDETTDVTLWRALAAEMGCAGLPVPEADGGAGASFRETAVVMEELGRAVAPVPFLGSAVLATAALLACDEHEMLSRLAGGEVTAALVIPLSASPWRPAAPPVRAEPVRAEQDGAGPERAELTGTVTGVADALAADVLLVPADGALYAIPAGTETPGGSADGSADGAGAGGSVSRTAVTSLDMTRQLCDITFRSAPGRRIASGEEATLAVGSALRAGAAMLASEQLGLAQRSLEMTVEYVKERHQFGRPVGSFQALKHRLSDQWASVAGARAAARYAADCVAAGDPDTDVAVAVAQAYCSEAAVSAAEECVQLHGGIGFTWEHPAHLYLKRAKSAALALGTADQHRAALAEFVDLPPPGSAISR